MERFGLGKLPADLLATLLERYARPDASVLVGPGIGEDAAVIDMGERCLVAKTDPITFAADAIGWYAVHVNANDVVCCGARPRWFLATLLLPEHDTTADLVEAIFAQMDAACRELEITLCGGHTEITHGLQRPIVVGQMLGEVAHGAYLTGAGAREGDAIILTKGIALEGTALIAREKPARLAEVMDTPALERCAGFLRDPGISVVREARLALEAGEVHALHDPTEGGLATGLWELAEAAGLGMRVEVERIPVLPECRLMCRHLGLDPLGLIGSGSLLVAAAPADAAAIVARISAAGITATPIGRLLAAEEGRWLCDADGASRPLPRFARDEIARLYA
ncbi:MAG: hydrogenase expression protein [Gammaproteobacteria bacterium]|nr:hydrogenase expression protein [Gammaproteobacteria bacterium]NIM73077.1 hydrogenase expression protein [Gammaproteobacteria bacterium]NIN38694.1 hydrogenase expression protein [Gammaproteobacteria bacterium]NIO24830.1 hydrogenase expression protein [Gammaproteobacteria bacterium]NIO65433.1 hydrogenase expression protein [Gammaproteobacteria bacterium]